MHYQPIEREAPALDLFDVETDTSTMCGSKPKPRCATDKEVRAYMRWLSDRARLHQFDDMSVGPRGATFGSITKVSEWDRESRSYTIAEYETGAYSIAMPGANQSATVTMETLDEAGAVILSQSLPIDPKKSGIIWDKAAVHRAVGPVAKPAKGQRKSSPPAVEICATPSTVEMTNAPAPAPVEREEAVEPIHAAPAIENAPSAPEIASNEGEEIKLSPAVPNDQPDLAAMVEQMAARLAQLESAFAQMDNAKSEAELPDNETSIALPAPWRGARQLAELRKSAERRAADRPRRERIARAYLALRARRDLDARALEAGRAYCATLQERAERAEQRSRGETMEAERLAFQMSEMSGQLAKETARADAAEAVAMPAIDRAQRRIGELEQQLAQASAAGFKPRSRIHECWKSTPRPMEQNKVTSNVIILSARG